MATQWCMEEYPTACQPHLDATSLNPEYFQIKDESTGRVLEVNMGEKGDELVFAESNGLSKQFWWWYREYNSEDEEGVMHIFNKLNNRVLQVYGARKKDEYMEVTAGNPAFKAAFPTLWTTRNGKIFSTRKDYSLLAIRDNKLVALKEGTDTTVVVSKASENTYPLTIKGDQCSNTPPTPKGMC